VVHHVGDLDPVREQLAALVPQRGLRTRLEGEVVEGPRHPEAAIDPRVVGRGDARHPPCLHEGEQLVAPGVEEDVPDLAALLHLQDVAADRLEAQHVLVEVPGPVQVERGEAHVGEALVGHRVLLAGYSIVSW